MRKVVFLILSIVVLVSFLGLWTWGKKNFGVPTRQINAGKDAARRFEISDVIGIALRKYYIAHGTAPTSLEELASQGLLPKKFLDATVTQSYMYYSADPDHGCRVEAELSDGSIVTSYCK